MSSPNKPARLILSRHNRKIFPGGIQPDSSLGLAKIAGEIILSTISSKPVILTHMKERLRLFLIQLPWPPLILAALLMGLAPFVPEPHLVEKLRMLLAGQLTRPVDLFDLGFHLLPTLLLGAKLLAGSADSRNDRH